ncbi:Crp/Fnr family transcriptional regulator [Ferdinandcohnia quinoae]|uniref:Crp/Fnr family transcriptional regulator n=1 Tax=Fredinandcohnia quinoae TaxID=2918902 RepID=A0AAW5ECR4_9BACI|nr:Crp/Fnr family transcriptional regulator [Fredinandcohnia sp. SECRCQ15]MCH1627792.1 Crp/Fnr family transcriptional regulator [Fredinandcohnia sp. SECRCQ15]
MSNNPLYNKENSKMTLDSNALNMLYTHLNQVVPIPSEEWDFFLTLISYRSIQKNSHFVQTDDDINEIGFCVKGLFRLYYVTPDGNEFNKNFCKAGDFVTCYSALLQNAPSYFSIQALSESHLIIFKYQDFQALRNRHMCWERLGSFIAEMLYLNKEIRERELLLFSAEKRYRLFLERFSSISEQIPIYHAASYLGITPVALSRIRRKINLC